MIVLKSIDIKKNIASSSLLVMGRFKNVDIKKTISFLSKEDQKNILDLLSVDLSDGNVGDYIILRGSSNFKRIMLFNLGDKDKLTSDTMRAFGAKLYSLVNSKYLSKSKF